MCLSCHFPVRGKWGSETMHIGPVLRVKALDRCRGLRWHRMELLLTRVQTICFYLDSEGWGLGGSETSGCCNSRPISETSGYSVLRV